MALCALCVTHHPDSLWAISVGDDYIHWHPHVFYTRHLSTLADPIAPQVVRILCRPHYAYQDLVSSPDTLHDTTVQWLRHSAVAVVLSDPVPMSKQFKLLDQTGC